MKKLLFLGLLVSFLVVSESAMAGLTEIPTNLSPFGGSVAFKKIHRITQRVDGSIGIVGEVFISSAPMFSSFLATVVPGGGTFSSELSSKSNTLVLILLPSVTGSSAWPAFSESCQKFAALSSIATASNPKYLYVNFNASTMTSATVSNFGSFPAVQLIVTFNTSAIPTAGSAYGCGFTNMDPSAASFF